jgi:hypothetical protein
MITCEDCGHQLEYKGRGRPPKYCKAHAKVSKQRLDRARPNNGHDRKEYLDCCLCAQEAGVRTTPDGRDLREANVFICEQHRQWEDWKRSQGYATDELMWRRVETGTKLSDEDIEAIGQLREVLLADGFRYSYDDRYLIPDPHMGYTGHGTKFGYDTQIEREAAEVLARNNPYIVEGSAELLAA